MRIIKTLNGKQKVFDVFYNISMWCITILREFLFKDRIDAAEKLSKELERLKAQWEHKGIHEKSMIILAIPRGGIVIADTISSKLGIGLDIIVSRKLGAPNNSELAIGAVMADGSIFPNQHVIDSLKITQDYINLQVNIQMEEIERRLINFRGSKEYDFSLKEKNIILVDDGIATGATILSAAQWLKSNQFCKKLVIAVPVAPPTDETNYKIKELTDQTIILYQPDPFYSVGQFYKAFPQITDKEVIEIMRRHGYRV